MFQNKINNKVFVNFAGKAVFADKRGKLINEIIGGIKMIKFNGIEELKISQVEDIRKSEKTISSRVFYLAGLAESMTTFMPLFCGLFSFWIYDLVYEEPLTTPQIFSIITLFNLMTAPIRFLKVALTQYYTSKVASDRIQKLTELQDFKERKDNYNLDLGNIRIENGTFTYFNQILSDIFSSEEEKKEQGKVVDVLTGINLDVKPGEFLAVIGKVGSGKSSLLKAIIQDMIPVSGTCSKHGRIAYIPQEAFLINDTIRANILFGREFDEEKYKSVLKKCELIQDLKIIKGGEMAEIGERGINLSGGQKQRISIARALYSDSDIYLIDDSLSALDSKVGKKIMENVFLKALKGKTRILVTHKLNILESVDKVLIMKLGSVVGKGNFEEIKQTNQFKQLAEEEKKHEKEVVDEEKPSYSNFLSRDYEIEKKKKIQI